jgi:hypothetical protein
MIKHACALIICTVVSAIICGGIGEALWPSGPCPLVSASMWFAGVAGINRPKESTQRESTQRGHDLRACCPNGIRRKSRRGLYIRVTLR